MKKTFVVADLHFHHRGVCIFENKRLGGKLRPWDNPEEMNEALVTYWNETVKPGERVYVLGDVIWARHATLGRMDVLGRLNGDLVMVGGNHDQSGASEYLKYFRDVRGVHEFRGCVLTHVPVHPRELKRWKLNVHGHLHSDVVELPDGSVDPRYICCSVEQEHMNFRPIQWDALMTVAESRMPKDQPE